MPKYSSGLMRRLRNSLIEYPKIKIAKAGTRKEKAEAPVSIFSLIKFFIGQ
jgi:hypothetical protein